MQTDRVCGLSIKADIDWSAGSCSYDLVWYEEWLDDYHGITVIRISSVSWGLWYNLNKTRIEKPHSACLPGNLAKEKKKEKKKKRTDRSGRKLIWMRINSAQSLLASLMGAHHTVREGRVKGKTSFIPSPDCHAFLFQSPLLSIPPSSSKSLLLLLSIPLAVPGKGIMFLPNQPKGQIKMCCTHSLSVCLIFLETKAWCKCSISLPLIPFTW